jgi:DNA-directed RNA polymerase subunit RPC12/RpoP
MNDATPYESARSYDSEESTVETVLLTVEDKKEEEQEDKFIACSHCGSKYKFLPTLKVPEDIFPPHSSVCYNRICHTGHFTSKPANELSQ